MENWNKRFLLAVAMTTGCLGGTPAYAQNTEMVIEPDIERRDIQRPTIDTEDFEVGLYLGVLSIADFNSEIVYGVRGAWHITEDFFFELDYGASEADLTSYEKLSGPPPLFKESLIKSNNDSFLYA